MAHKPDTETQNPSGERPRDDRLAPDGAPNDNQLPVVGNEEVTGSAQDGDPPRSIDGFITYRLARVQARLNVQAARLLRDVSGISLPQWRVVALLGDVTETTSRELVRRSAIDKGLVSRTLKTLQAEGYVETRLSKADQRVQKISLTPKGRALFEKTLPHMHQRQRIIEASCSAEELRIFRAVLQRLEILADIEAFDP
ncbi:MAG: MarR family winged helix-turn-helix transcriptional regulator [Pseudomonadota bacterium]